MVKFSFKLSQKSLIRLKKGLFLSLLLALVFLVYLSQKAEAPSPENSNSTQCIYTSSSRICGDINETGHCLSGQCSVFLGSGTQFAQDSDGKWVNPSEILRITKYQDDLTFHYSGIEGYFNITFEAGTIYNDNYYSMAWVKQNTGTQFNFPTYKTPTVRKYAVNITGITLDKTKIENITLTYKDHYGFTLDQLKPEGGRYIAKNIMELVFDDLRENLFTINIVKAEKRIYISNITLDKFNGDSLYLDPTIMLQDADTENLDDVWVYENTPDTNSGDEDTPTVSAMPSYTQTARIMLKFNLSAVPSGQTIEDAELYMYYFVYWGEVTPDVSVHHIYNQTWLEEIETWNNQVCGSGFDQSSQCNLTADDTISIDTTTGVWKNWNVTKLTKIDYDDVKTNVSMIVKQVDETGTDNVKKFYSKEYTTDTTLRPYLNITYSSAGDTTKPYFSTNETNTTTAGYPVNFSIVAHDETAVDFCRIETNNTGTFTNSSWQDISGTSENCYYETTLNSTTSILIHWRAYANDTSDNWNTSQTFNLTTTNVNPPQADYVSPTDADNSYVSRNYTYINVSETNDTDVDAFIVQWDGVNKTIISNNTLWFSNTTGLVGFWKFDNDTSKGESYNNSNGSTVYDYSGFGNNGTTYGDDGPNYTSSGKWNGALEFDGSDDYVEVDGIVSDLSSTTTGTWTVWFKVVDATPSANLYPLTFGDTDADEFILLGVLTTGKLQSQVRDSGTTQFVLDTDNSVFNDNTWTHVAVVQNGTEPVLYVDGIKVAQTFTTDTNKTSWFSELTGLDNGRIGRLTKDNGNYGFFNGTIDEVSVWNRSLSASEIYEIYSTSKYAVNITQISDGTYNYTTYINDTAGNENSTSLRTITIDTTIPQVDYTTPSDSDNVYLNRNWTYVNASVTELNPDQFTIEWNNTNYTVWDNTSLVLRMHFNEGSGTSTDDESIYENDGTLTGFGDNAVNWTTGVYGNALEFDGVDDYVNVSDDASLDITDKLTIEVWVKPSIQDSDYNGIVSKTDSNTNGWELRTTTYTASTVNIQFRSSNGTQREKTHTLNIDTWYHLVGVYDGSKLELFVNGESKGTTNSEDGIGTNSRNLLIGTLAYSSNLNFNGTIDEVSIWSKALTADEINFHYKSQLGKYWVNVTNQTDGEYTYKTFLNDTAGNVNSTSLRTLTVDTSKPQVDLVSPTLANNSYTSNDWVYVNTSVDGGLCVTPDTELILESGERVRIVDIKEGQKILSLNETSGQVESARVNALLDMGIKPVFRVTTASGRVINTTSNHPYLTKIYDKETCDKYAYDVWNKNPDNFDSYCTRWVRVSEIMEGTKIAVPTEQALREIENKEKRQDYFDFLDFDEADMSNLVSNRVNLLLKSKNSIVNAISQPSMISGELITPNHFSKTISTMYPINPQPTTLNNKSINLSLSIQAPCTLSAISAPITPKTPASIAVVGNNSCFNPRLITSATKIKTKTPTSIFISSRLTLSPDNNIDSELKNLDILWDEIISIEHFDDYSLIVTESGIGILTTANHPYLTKDGWVKVKELKEGIEIAVPSEEILESINGLNTDEVVEAFDCQVLPSTSLIKSKTPPVLSIFTSDCMRKCGSYDQIGQLNFNANAKKSISFGSADICIARSRNSPYSPTEKSLISGFMLSSSSFSSSSVNPDLLTMSGQYLLISLNMKDGEIKSSFLVNNISKVIPLDINAAINTLVSMTSFNYTKPSFLSCSNLCFLILRPIFTANSIASSSDSLLFEDMDLTIKNLVNLSRSSSLVTSDQFISGCASIRDLNVLGTDNVIVFIPYTPLASFNISDNSFSVILSSDNALSNFLINSSCFNFFLMPCLATSDQLSSGHFSINLPKSSGMDTVMFGNHITSLNTQDSQIYKSFGFTESVFFDEVSDYQVSKTGKEKCRRLEGKVTKTGRGSGVEDWKSYLAYDNGQVSKTGNLELGLNSELSDSAGVSGVLGEGVDGDGNLDDEDGVFKGKVGRKPQVVFWDRIVSIEYLGEEQVYDVEIEGTHNFIGNEIFAHNTYADAQNLTSLINWNNSLKGWWRFDDNSGTTVSDYSGYGNDGTAVNFACTSLNCNSLSGWTSNGKFGTGMVFDGLNDYIGVGDKTEFNFDENDFAISAWFKTNSFSAYGMIVTKRLNEVPSNWYQALKESNNLIIALRFNYSGTPSGVVRLRSDNPINDNLWHYFVFSRNESTCYLYVDGVLNDENNGCNINISSSGDFEIGSYGGGYQLFNGTIDEVRIYDRALSAQEINASYRTHVNRLYGNFTSLGDAEWNYTVYTQDLAGNVNDTGLRIINLDSSPPGAPTLTSPTDNDHTNDNTTTFDWSDVTDTFGVNYTFMIYNDSSLGNDNVTLNKTSFTQTSAYTLTAGEALSDGTYYWRVRANSTGGVGDWADNFSLIIDIITPDIAWGIYPRTNNETFVSGNLSVDFNVSDSNLYRINVTVINATDNQKYNYYTDNWNSSLWESSNEIININVSTWDDGNYTMEVSGTDDHTFGGLKGLKYVIHNDGIKFFKGNSSKKIYAGYYLNGEYYFLTSQQIRDYSIKFKVSKIDSEYKFNLSFNKPPKNIKFGFAVPKTPKMHVRDESTGHITWKDWYLDFGDMVSSGYPITFLNTKNYYVIYSNTKYCSVPVKSKCVFDPTVGGLNNVTEYANFTVDNTDPLIRSFSLNDTYINFNQSVIIEVNATDNYNVSSVTAEIQTTARSVNVSLVKQSNGNWTYDMTKTELGESQENVTKAINITKIYTQDSAGNEVSNTTTLSFDYTRTTHSSSVSPSETYNSADDYITFTSYYNETTTEEPIGGNCTVATDGTTYDLYYSGEKHYRVLSVYGWTDQTYSFTVTCTNTSYQNQTSTGSFIIRPSGSPGAGTGTGSPGGITTTTTTSTTTFPETPLNMTGLEKIFEKFTNKTQEMIEAIGNKTMPNIWEPFSILNPVNEDGTLKESSMIFYMVVISLASTAYVKRKELKGMRKRKKKKKPKTVYIED